ncbi:MAG: bifunctional riboflavin kinase/FAD synthetase [Saprospiraceae bacterium]
MEVHRGLYSLPIFEKPVITFGSFDGIHKGHRVILNEVIQKAKKRNTQSVIISFHPHPREIIYPKDKTLKLISSVDDKIELLESLGADHFVIIPFKIEFSQITPQEYIENVVIKKFDPQLIVIGYDHRFGLNRGGGFEMLEDYGKRDGFEVEVTPAQHINTMNISSTKIRNALKVGDIPLANNLLGYAFAIRGKIVHGDKIGRTLGFPTANIKLDHPKKIIPQNGIYAVKIKIRDKLYLGMLYIGTRSTISEDLKPRVEVNIFDFDQEVYGEKIIISFYKKIRDDEQFKNMAILSEAISLDQNAVNSYFRLKNDQNHENAKVTIAILNYNGEEMLEAYLPKMLYSSKGNFDICVIDNASTDKSVYFLEQWHPEVKIIQLTENHGFAGGYNRGIESINTEYMALINSDVLVTDNWLDTIIDLLESDNSIAAVQPKILSLEEKSTFEYAGAGGGLIDKLGYPFCRGRIFDNIEEDSGQYNDTSEVFWISGAAMVIRTDLFKKFGGFDPDYFAHHEEIDLCWRLKNAGYNLKYLGTSTVYHLGGGTLDYDNPRKAFLNYRNNIRTIIKNEPLLLRVLLTRYLFDLGSSFLFLLQGKVGLFAAIWKAYFFNTIKLPYYLNKRRNIRLMISRFKKHAPNRVGQIRINLPWKYYISGIKNFKDLSE